jgi:iron complex outermembrane receptor protein
MKGFCLHILLFFCASHALAGDTIALKTIDISAGGTALPSGKLIKAGLHHAANMGEWLAAQGVCQVREYAPGGISVVSMRGGNAQQSAVCWNGLPINSLFVGLSDLSLLPSGFFGATTLNPRMDASTPGSLAGTLDLREDSLPTKGLEAGIAYGNFGRVYTHAQTSATAGDWSGQAGIFVLNDVNRFMYKPQENSPAQKMKHAEVHAVQALYGLSFKNKFWLRAWHTQSQRNIPPTLAQHVSGAFQQDENHRFAAGFSFAKGAWNHQLTMGSFTDHIRYHDPSISLYSPAFSWQGSLLWQSRHKKGFSFSLLSQHARTANNGHGLRNIQWWRTYPGFTYNRFLIPRHLLFKLAAYGDMTDQFPAAWNASSALYLFIKNDARMFVSASRSNRFPTLNDRYWLPGGNPSLKPEQGMEYEAGMQFTLPQKAHRLHTQFSVFYRDIRNQIVWLPQNNFWQAQNFSQTQTFGHHFSLSWEFLYRHASALRLAFQGIYQRSENAENKGIQQVYIPSLQYMVQAQWSLPFLQTGMQLNHTALRYTLGDGSAFLPPFYTCDAWLESHSIRMLPNVFVRFGCTGRNLGNTVYQWVYQRPMPLRSFLLHCKFTFTYL